MYYSFTSRDTHNQTQEVVEDWDGFSNDPGDDPNDADDQDPDTNGNEASFSHAASTAEDADVDLLGGDVGVDDTRNDDLSYL